ncbi:MAG: sigma 54-interacting transcriptional regulator [Negativicutes bacterium]|nr:sigma 54-interacting transcriptional regulator [Negativicutes bacterium]
MSQASDQEDFTFFICDEELKVVWVDPAAPAKLRNGKLLDRALGGKKILSSHYATFHTKHGVVLIFPYVLPAMNGYLGVLCRQEPQDEVIGRLAESNKELEAIFESSHDGIVVADNQGRLIRINHSYERITGIPTSEIVGLTMNELIERKIVSDSATLRVLNTGKPTTFSQVFRTGRHSIITGSPIYGDQGEIFRVVTNVRDMTEINSLKEQLAESQKKLDQYSQIVETLTEEQLRTGALIYRSPGMQKLLLSALKFAKVDAPLLITGESGVGKEVVADLIYKNSTRKGSPFLKINCGAIPETLLEAELFGYEGGAYTGAKKGGQLGLFEMADGGTILLDEIGELSLSLQVKLLRVVQQKEFYRVGGNSLIKVDVRIIAATNRALEEMVKGKQFRSDLFYRLNVLKLHIPPLRERPEDIIPLANHFLKKYSEKHGIRRKLTGELYRFFIAYQWPGNVRELENLVERLLVIADSDEITLEHVPEEMRRFGEQAGVEPLTFREAREEFEREFLRRALEKYKSTRKAAEKLAVDHSTVVKKAARYGIKLYSNWNEKR